MRLPLLIVGAVLALSACDAVAPSSADASTPASEARPAPAGVDGLAAVRRATAKYHDVDRALADEYGTIVRSECVEVPALGGGMGYHYVNLGLMDGTVEASAPEVVLYEPQKNGRLRLVAVEYIVPVERDDEGNWVSPGDAPELFGQAFHLSGAAGGWALHAWVWKNNPTGMFQDWNPNVSCEHAES